MSKPRNFVILILVIASFVIFVQYSMWSAYEFDDKVYFSNLVGQRSDIPRKIHQYYNRSMVAFQTLPVGSVHIMSAIARPDQHWNIYTKIVLNTWDDYAGDDLKCCFLYKGQSYDGAEGHVKEGRVSGDDFKGLRARVFECLLEDNKKFPWKVALAQGRKQCADVTNMIEVEYPTRKIDQLAVCTKIAYGKLNPFRIIEWVEYNKMMGVDKVFSFIDNLDNTSLSVLQYYEKEGFIELHPFAVPGTIGGKTRGFEEKRRIFPQFTIDERISAFECEGRMQGYTYASLIDFDEFLILRKHKNFKDFLKEAFLSTSRFQRISGIHFESEFFILDWRPISQQSKLWIMSYQNRTAPRWECYKYIYKPTHVREYSVNTHQFEEKGRSYKGIRAKPADAVIHHYRECPHSWKDCFTLKRYTDTFMLQFNDTLEDKVRNVKQHLQL